MLVNALASPGDCRARVPSRTPPVRISAVGRIGVYLFGGFEVWLSAFGSPGRTMPVS